MPPAPRGIVSLHGWPLNRRGLDPDGYAKLPQWYPEVLRLICPLLNRQAEGNVRRTGTLATFGTILLDEGHVVAINAFPRLRSYLVEAVHMQAAYYKDPGQHPNHPDQVMSSVYAQVWLCIQDAPPAEGVSVPALTLQDLADIPSENKSYTDYTLEEWTLTLRGLRCTIAWQEGTAKLTLENSAAGDLERVVLRGFEQLGVDRIPGIASRIYWERVLQLMMAEAGGREREEWRHPPEATPAPGASASASATPAPGASASALADGRDPSRITLLEACRQDGT